MQRHTGERGAALILLMGITATLAILAASLVVVLANQQSATASERQHKTSAYYAESALDNVVCVAKNKTMPHTDPGGDGNWLTLSDDDLRIILENAGFPAAGTGATVTHSVYDNLGTKNAAITWDQGSPTSDSTPDNMVWLEVVVSYQGKATRFRVLLAQTQGSVVSSLPRSVLYCDTGIQLKGTSDLYAVKPDGSPYGSMSESFVTAGGGYATGASWPNSAGEFQANTNSNLAAPGSSIQSLGVKAAKMITPAGHTYQNSFAPTPVKLLSDYFDQGCQADLGDEAATGSTPPTAPTAPTALTASGTSVAYTQFSTTNLTAAYLASIGASFNSATKTYTFNNDIQITGGNLTLKTTGTAGTRGVFPAGTIFNFHKLSMESTRSLTVTSTATGRLTLTTTSFYAGGALTISNSGTTATVADSFGPLHVVGALSVTGNVTLTTTSLYAASTATINNNTTAAVTDTFGPFYAVGAITVSGPVTINSSSAYYSLYGGSTVSITGPSSTVTDYFGPFYAVGAITLSGQLQVNSTSLYTGGDFNVTGSTSGVSDHFGRIYATGIVTWSGYASVKTTDWTKPNADPPDTGSLDASNMPGAVWVGRLRVSGTYHDLLGDTWVNGGADTSNTVDIEGPSSGSASTFMCPLLATTEQTKSGGEVNFGTRARPMTYYMQCDNDGGYFNTCDWGSTGTFCGLMVIMEARIEISGGDGTTPSIEGAVFVGAPYTSSYDNPNGDIGAGYDITLTGASTVAYNQAVIDAVSNWSIVTTTTFTTVVEGSWQQMPTN